MYCRSLLMISRYTLKTSNISSRYLRASCNNYLLFSHQDYRRQQQQQQNRYLTQNVSNQKPPGRIRRFFRWLVGSPQPVKPIMPPPPKLTTMQRLKRFLSLSPMFERFLLRSHIIDDEDLARLIAKTAAISLYSIVAVTTLGTLGVDTKPLLAGIGITGFTIGFALKEVATNFISGVFLVINKPFVRGCRIKIHGSGGGIEGIVHSIDVRYVHLKIKDRGVVMIPSSVVYINPFTVFPADDDANAGFLDMTKPSKEDPTKPPESSSTSSSLSSPTSKISNTKEKSLKMKFDGEPAGSFKKAPFNEKL